MKHDPHPGGRRLCRLTLIGIAALVQIPVGVFLPSTASGKNIEVRARIQPNPLVLKCQDSFDHRDYKTVPWAVLQRTGESRESWKRRNERLRDGREVIRRLLAKGYRKVRDIKNKGIVEARLVLRFRVKVRTSVKLEFQVKADQKGAVRWVKMNTADAQTKTEPSGVRGVLSRETEQRVVQGLKSWSNRQRQRLQAIYNRLNGRKTRWREKEWDQIRLCNKGMFTRNTSFTYCGNKYELQAQVKWRNPDGLFC